MLKLKKTHYILLSAGLFAAFVFFSYLVHKGLFIHFDFDTTVRLQDDIPRRFDIPFSWLSIIGNAEVMSVVLFVVLGWIAFKYKNLKAIIAFILFAGMHLFELYGKYFVNHPPPPFFMLRTQYPVNFPQFYISTQNSYPSGHAARGLFVSLLIAFLISKYVRLKREHKWILYLFLGVYDLALVVSRVYLGEHWSTDVIGGSILGASFALASFVLL